MKHPIKNARSLARIVLLTSTAFFCQANAHATSLKEAMALAYQHNPALQSERENLKLADEAMPQALSGWLPSASLSYARGHQDQELGSTNNDGITDSKAATVVQPLFQGGETIAKTRQAEHTVAAARYRLTDTEQSILLEAVTAYMDIVRDQDVLELSKKNQTVLSKHLEAAKERHKLGEVTLTDVAQAEASLARARSEVINAEGSLEASRAGYVRVIGAAPSDINMPTNPVVIEATLDELLGKAKEQNPALKSLEERSIASERSIAIAKAALLPDVNLKGSKQRQLGSLFSGGSALKTTSVGVEVSVPLYQSGAEYSRVRQAKNDLERVKYDLDDQRNRVNEETIRAYQNFQVARASIKSNESSVKAYESALHGTEEEAKVGARTTLDVLDAEQDLFQAQVNLVRSKRDEIVSAYSVLAQIGKLTAKDLELDVTPYNPEEHYNDVKYQIIGF